MQWVGELLNGFRQRKFPVLVATDIGQYPECWFVFYLLKCCNKEGNKALSLHKHQTVVLLLVLEIGFLIHYELSDDPETFVHRCGRTGCAGQEGFGVTRPAEQMVATVQPESSQFFTPSARKLIGEQRRSALPTRLGHLSEKDAHAEGSVYSAAANASHN
ncbi:hypothetical protein DKX38_019164 [Salix brachista]|uniref:Helicase C-terminal domain-containing protein n=1 Tax=Salix brachista TaxID=2182728 RepID=A0A5N5KFH9_9ROSI|nr:hypothetical protein DKX38_019164 [Salix brachista]